MLIADISDHQTVISGKGAKCQAAVTAPAVGHASAAVSVPILVPRRVMSSISDNLREVHQQHQQIHEEDDTLTITISDDVESSTLTSIISDDEENRIHNLHDQ